MSFVVLIFLKGCRSRFSTFVDRQSRFLISSAFPIVYESSVAFSSPVSF